MIIFVEVLCYKLLLQTELKYYYYYYEKNFTFMVNRSVYDCSRYR